MGFSRGEYGVQVQIGADELNGKAADFFKAAYQQIAGINIDAGIKDYHQRKALVLEPYAREKGTLAEFIASEASGTKKNGILQALDASIGEARGLTAYTRDNNLRGVVAGLTALRGALAKAIGEQRDAASTDAREARDAAVADATIAGGRQASRMKGQDPEWLIAARERYSQHEKIGRKNPDDVQPKRPWGRG